MSILKIFKNSWILITENKLKMMILFVTQLLFFILIAFINVTYQLELAENANALIAPLNTANYNAESIKSGVPFLENIGQIYSTYEHIVASLKKLIGFQLFAFLTIGLLLWTITHSIFETISVLRLLQLYAHLLGRALLFIVPSFALIYILLQTAFETAFIGTDQTIDTVYVALGLFFISMYFMVICLALAQKSMLTNIRTAFVLGVMKAHYLLSCLIGIAALISLLGYTIYWSLDFSLFIVTPAIALFVAAFIFGRILFVATVEKVNQ